MMTQVIKQLMAFINLNLPSNVAMPETLIKRKYGRSFERGSFEIRHGSSEGEKKYGDQLNSANSELNLIGI